MATKITLSDEDGVVGSAVFYAIPLNREHDFRCSPEGLITFLQAKRIAYHLATGRDDGQIGDYEFWVSE
jgi:hypothetical protein